MEILQTLIPSSHLTAVEIALHQVFQTTVVQELVLLTGGLSNSPVYKMTVNDQVYVLKLGSSSACMEIAAKAGIAPPVYYNAAGIIITGFKESTSKVLLPELAWTIKRVHELSAFPVGNPLVNTVDTLIAQFNGPGFEECLAYYKEIRKHYPWDDTDRVPSHNDLNPGNLICTDEKIWVIDWDAAHQNDRYVDLAIAANFYVANKEQEDTFLNTYFNGVSDYQRARFFLMRQVCRIVYAILLFNKNPIGQTLLNQALVDMRSPRFADELNQMADI